MAAFRALESAKPPAERLFRDAYAPRFLPLAARGLVALARLPALRMVLERYADARAPGARSSGVARTRLIDEWVAAACQEGAEQIVFLGAGFDCRALRLPALQDVRVFELDRAALLAMKARRLGAAPANLTRVPIDFLNEAVEAKLSGAGFDAGKRTLFVWEGVTNYLDAPAVASILSLAGRLRARIIFTYVHADAVAGRFDAPGLTPLLQRLRAIGEPWTFGLRPETLPGYLAAHGLQRCADLGAAEYRALYRATARARPEGYEFYRVVLAAPL